MMLQCKRYICFCGVFLYMCFQIQAQATDFLHFQMDSMQKVYGLKLLKDSADYQAFVDSLMTSSNIATNKRAFELAVNYLDIAEYAARYYIGENSIAHARILYSFGFSYARNNAFVKAEPYLERALKIYDNYYGELCERCAKTLNTLGFVYHFQGKYDKVEACLERSLAIYEKLYGKYQSDYINSLNSFCIFLKDNGQYERALQKFPELLELNEKLFSKQNNNYIAALMNFSYLLVELDQLEKAEELRLEAVNISENLNGKQNVTYAQALFALATFYKNIYQTEKAEKYLLESKEIYENLNLTNLPEYARVLNNLGNLYLSIEKYLLAESLLLRSKAIIENVLGKRHFEYAQSIESLGVLKSQLGLYGEAEVLISEALEIKLASRGKNEDYTKTLMLLGKVYISNHKLDDAQLILEESLNIRQNLFGNQHNSVAESLKAVSNIYELKANYVLADSFRLAYFNLVQSIFQKAKSYMSLKELRQYTKNYLADLDESVQNYFKRNSNSKTLAEICFNNALFYKGFLMNELLTQKSILETNPNLKDKYNLMLKYSRQLATQLTKPVLEQKNVAELEHKIERLEKEFSKRVSNDGHSLQVVRWQDVRQSLKDGEVAIEWVHYNIEKGHDSIMYAALIVAKASESPTLIALCREKQLTDLVEGAQHQSLHCSHIYNYRDFPSTEKNNNLYTLIWKPLLANLNGVRRIYFSSAGFLHRINLGAISDNKGKCMMDHYKIISLNSTRQLIYNSTKPVHEWNNQAVLLGGIQYDLEGEQLKQTPDKAALMASATRSLSFVKRDSTYKVASWSYLPASLKEVKSLSSLLHTTKIQTRLLTSYDATESFCKTYDANTTSPRILHFATHGFFYPDQRSNLSVQQKTHPIFQRSKDPMVRSGLIMAYANFSWMNGYIHNSLDDDGVLTSLEISQLNLSNTELAVLSACETGLGDVADYEGVYGLQRAFKMAGVKNILMSLWQIPDKETAELMSSFYRYWLVDHYSKHDALYLAQKEMRDKGMKSFYWAGFVLVE